MGGDLNVTWIHGAPNHCASPIEPRIQVHRFDADTFILRQSKCSEPGTPDAPGPSFEAPFMYLMIGKSRAFLLGLLSDVDSRLCWQSAEQAGDASPHAMQRLLGEAVWDRAGG